MELCKSSFIRQGRGQVESFITTIFYLFEVAKEFGDKINFIGVRIDSGDMAYLSKKVRKMLDDAGFPDAKIIASNGLDEKTIQNLQMQGAKIDTWGIGTKLITAYDQPTLGAVYKLVAIEDTTIE